MITFNDLWTDYRRNGSHKYCFYHDKTNCSHKIKRAHSVQKEKILTQLEELINGNKLIYSLDSCSDKDFKVNGLIPIGKKKASIFTGFCDYHDSKLFSPIENHSFDFTEEQLFLMTYRTFAHDFHQLLETYKYYVSNGSYIKYFPKHLLKGYIQLTEFRIKKSLSYKKVLDSIIESKNYSLIKYHTRVIEPFIPLASSSILSPFYTYKNKFLNPNEEYSYVILNVLPDTIRTIVILSQFEQDNKGQILFDELRELPNHEFTKAISSLIIYCTTNTFFSPNLWDKFTEEQKERLYQEINFCTMKGDKIDKFFTSEINFFEL